MPHITVTGIDEHLAAADIYSLLDEGAEVGVLYSYSHDGRNRYPTQEWIVEVASRCGKGQLAIHVCGKRARGQLLRGHVMFRMFSRIQVNGVVSGPELELLCNIYDESEIITQRFHDWNEWLDDSKIGNHAILMDSSGGCGNCPDMRWAPNTDQKVGFAGGLGPHNLREELPKIKRIATGDWWIDMESGVRTKDWFDMDKAFEAIRQFKELTQ